MKLFSKKPPKFAEFLMSHSVDIRDRNMLLGDFEEFYNEKLSESGLLKAKVWYWVQVVKSLPRTIDNIIYWRTTMLMNYIKIALRNLRLNKSFSFINITGLAIGFTCCLLIMLFVNDELSYDKFHTNADRIFRLQSEFGENNAQGNSSFTIARKLKEQFPQIEKLVNIDPTQAVFSYGDKRIEERSAAIVDEEFFNVFSFNLVSGNREDALKDVYAVVINETVAKKFFNDENPMGKQFSINDGQYNLTVTGVMKNMPENSHFRFDYLISMKTGMQYYNEQVKNNTGEHTPYIYMMLQDNYDYNNLNVLLPDFVEDAYGQSASDNVRLSLTKLKDIYLTSNTRSEIGPTSDLNNIYIFATIGFFTLFIACINYMNLATARSTKRAREVGMRKILGAHKFQLIYQFLGESIMITFIALILSLGISYISLPAFNNFSGKSLSINIFSEINLLLTFIGSAALIGILAGSYPAFFLSAFQPLKVIKGVLTRGSNGTLMRKSLVVIQFGISIVLIIGTSIVFSQLDYLRNKKIGINKDAVILVPMQTMKRSSEYPAFKAELLANPNINIVSASNKKMSGNLSSNFGYEAEAFEKDPNVNNSIKVVTIDPDFFKVFENEFAFGRDFDMTFESDASEGVVLNASAVKHIGWEQPIGKWFKATVIPNKEKTGNIIGVVEDFHYESLYNRIVPAMFTINKTWLNWVYVKIDGNNIPETIDYIGESYANFVTDRKFQYSFLDEDINALYNAEDRFLRVFALFTGLAIAIACLGIFGLASFTAEKRTKEIGIRKVLGASVENIVSILVKEFTYLVLFANVIAWPVAYFLMEKWLEGFIYKTEIGLSVFFVSMFTAFFIAVSTVMYQAIKAGWSDPSKALKYE